MKMALCGVQARLVMMVVYGHGVSGYPATAVEPVELVEGASLRPPLFR